MLHYFYPVMAERIRTTISLDPEVHAVFVAMAEAAGTSVSRCMGDWLADTAEGAQFVAMKMQEARKAPKTVMREMQAMSRGLLEEVNSTLDGLRKGGIGGGGGVEPPSSPTGVKSPGKGKSQGRKAA